MPDHHGVPYSLTEDFVTVYRMHPLIPDDYRFVDHRDRARSETRTFLDIQGTGTDKEMRRLGLRNVLYSFGISHPGAITLHNYPRVAAQFERDGEIIDLSVVDLVRTRRRGVPRYNDFRAGLHKPRITPLGRALRRPEERCAGCGTVYRSVDEVDTMVGLFAETPPARLRLLRHGVPDLHPDGVAAAAERPLPHRRLPARDLLAARHGLGRPATA